MPSKKKKYNARFPAGRIKKIMQSDEEIGKVAQAVPVIISRTLELFVESLLTKTLKITNTRNAKTLSPTHLKQCIMAEQRFDFLRELVKNLPDISLADEAAANYEDVESSPEQDSFSDAATEPSTSMNMTTNGMNEESKLRRTRSAQQFDLQQHELWERLQKPNFGVIKHTNNNNKLLRTESMPNAEPICLTPKRARQTATTTTATSTTTIIAAAKCKQTNIAPIVSVQLDYSNIKNVPHSAPAQNVQPAVFDFSHQTPISINIDLSSININKSTTTTTITTATTTTTIPKASTTTTILAKPKTILELDEDYDDI